ncbi:hypothetical protein OH77DRAFT_1046496 [Trametes cingulata]|nr:hypothetical protein OH77DRAFT_1046496 [Trametes cingulata]
MQQGSRKAGQCPADATLRSVLPLSSSITGSTKPESHCLTVDFELWVYTNFGTHVLSDAFGGALFVLLDSDLVGRPRTDGLRALRTARLELAQRPTAHGLSRIRCPRTTLFGHLWTGDLVQRTLKRKTCGRYKYCTVRGRRDVFVGGCGGPAALTSSSVSRPPSWRTGR